MRRGKRAFCALIAALMNLCASPAEAQNIEGICRAIAQGAGRAGPALGERDIYDLSAQLVAAVPATMRYPQPRTATSTEIVALLGCDDPTSCNDRYAGALEGLIDNGGGPWWTQVVDTRPVSNEVFVFTAHSGIFRSDQFVAFEQQADKRLKLMPFGFNESEAYFDTGYAILLVDSKPYVVVPPSVLSLADFSGYRPTKQSVDFHLSVYDPRNAAAFCTVTYRIVPRSTVRADSILGQVEPPPAPRNDIRAFLDRNLEVIARKTELGGDLGERVSASPIFVPSTLASGELARLQALLSDRKELDFLHVQRRALAKSIFGDYWDQLEAKNKVETWETRWFSVEIARQGYIGLLLRTGLFGFNPKHDADKSVVALFTFEGGALKPVAAYEIQSVYRFTGADVGKNP